MSANLWRKISVLQLILACTTVYECAPSEADPVVSGTQKVEYGPARASTPAGALILTPYIEYGQLEDALQASEVRDLPGLPRLKSYSGYFTVNKTYNSNLFFWFFPALSGDSNAPLLLWLSGGPGDASVRGMFTQIGPIQIDANGNAFIRNSTWNREFALLYIDNPVGTGFSFTNDEAGYSRDQRDISQNLYEALRQFFLVFPKYQPNPLYLTGYAYACKFHSVLALLILAKNYLNSRQPRGNSLKMNLKGMAISGGYCDPRNQYDFADYLYQSGLIDDNQWVHFWLEQSLYIRAIIEEEYEVANEIINNLYFGFYFGTREGSYFHNVTGYASLANILRIDEPPELDYFRAYLERPQTRRVIHVGNVPFNSPATLVSQTLNGDIAQSVRPQMERLLNADLRILFYNGNLNLVAPVPIMENMLRSLDWKGRLKYSRSRNRIYTLASQSSGSNEDSVPLTVGYIRRAYNLNWVIIRNSGHYVPIDQPQVALDLITKFVKRIDL